MVDNLLEPMLNQSKFIELFAMDDGELFNKIPIFPELITLDATLIEVVTGRSEPIESAEL
jgi:hypothetical protein